MLYPKQSYKLGFSLDIFIFLKSDVHASLDKSPAPSLSENSMQFDSASLLITSTCLSSYEHSIMANRSSLNRIDSVTSVQFEKLVHLLKRVLPLKLSLILLSDFNPSSSSSCGCCLSTHLFWCTLLFEISVCSVTLRLKNILVRHTGTNGWH